MSDALCGPSNPLQQFKQQTQFDRTLQQDRLTSRHSPAQGFRSQDPNAGLLDPEFEAFQAGVPANDLPHFQPFQRPPSLAGPAQVPSWAADFQRMQISAPLAPHQQQLHASYAAPSSAAGWTQGFQEHIAQAAPRAQNSAAPSPQAFQHMARYGVNGFQNNFAQPTFASNVQQSKGKEAVTEQFDEDAFERHFNQVQEALLAEERLEQDMPQEEFEAPYATGASTGNFEEQESLQEIMREYTEAQVSRRQLWEIEQQNKTEEGVHHLESGVDTVDIDDERHHEDVDLAREHEAEPLSEQQAPNDDDALALTAQELLDKVEHNQTDKFRNSQFLSLMRRLRDREVKVEGDKMVETAANASTATDFTSFDPMSARFDNSEQTLQPIQQRVEDQLIDGTPNDASYHIPTQEQDHDLGRIDPRDGQEVVDLLSQKLDDTVSTPDIGTSIAPNLLNTRDELSIEPGFPPGVFYGDLRQRGWSDVKTEGHSLDGALLQQPIDWKRWDLHSPGYRSHRSAQPAPGLH